MSKTYKIIQWNPMISENKPPVPTVYVQFDEDLFSLYKYNNGRVSIRNIRKEANDHLKKLLKEHVSEDNVRDAEDEIQKLTDQYISKIEDYLKKKEEDIMTV